MKYFKLSKRKEIHANALMLFVMVLFIIATCTLENTSSLFMSPLTLPADFLASIPYFTVNFFGSEVVIQQISSTIMVWGLGVLIVSLGIAVLIKQKSKAGMYWGIGLILWGLGAIVAGVSYQAFGYQLKAANQQYVLFTSDWELSYMILTAFATNYMMVGTAMATAKDDKLQKIVIFAIVHSIAYCIYMLFGSIFAIEFVISYFGFVVFVAVDFLIMLILNYTHYKANKDQLNKHMIFTWLDFAVVNMAYFVCYFAGMGNFLYSNLNIWFNENDVLHLLLMVWAVHVYIVLTKFLKRDSER